MSVHVRYFSYFSFFSCQSGYVRLHQIMSVYFGGTGQFTGNRGGVMGGGLWGRGR